LAEALDRSVHATVSQIRNHVAHGGRTQTHQHRILGLVDDFVDFAGLETGGHADVCRIGESPLVARDQAALPVHGIADEHFIRPVVHLCARISGQVAIAKRNSGDPLISDPFRAHQAVNGLAMLGGDGRIDSEQAGRRWKVGLPADPDQREALFEQEVVAKIELREQAFVPSIRNLQQGGSVALAWIKRPEHVKIRGKFDLPLRRCGW